MKHRGLYLLWHLVMVLSLLPVAAGAQQVVADPQGQPLALGSQCVHGDALLVWTRQGLYRFKDGEEKASFAAPVPEGVAVHLLISDGQKLYGLNIWERLLYPLALEGDALTAGDPLKLVSDLLEDPLNQHLWPLNAAVAGDRLYLLFQPDATGGWHGEVHAFHLTDGRGSQVDLPFPQWFTPGPENTLLLLSHDYRAASATVGTGDDHATVHRYDPATGQVEELFALPRPFSSIGGQPMILWDEARGELLYTDKGSLYRRRADGGEQLAARLPDLDIGGSGAPFLRLPGGSLALASRGQSVVMGPQAQAASAAAQPLVIYGMADRNLHQRVLAALPGLNAQLMEAFWQDDTMLAQQLQTGASAIDVLYLSSHMDEVRPMMDKGYLMDLSASPAIREHVDLCYPAIGETVQKGDGIYLLPIMVDSMLYTYRPQLFEELGLTVPATFDELAGLLQDWADDDGQLYAQHLPLSQGQPRREMMTEALRMAFLQQAVQGEVYRFDDPLLRTLLARAMAMNLGALEFGPEDYSFMDRPALMAQTNLSLGFMSMSDSMGPGERIRPLMLKPAEDLPAVLPVHVGYLAIYAASDNQEAALKYLESALVTLEHETKVKLYPGFDEPLETSGITEMLARHSANIERLKKEMDQAQGAQKTELERQLAEAVRIRDEQETFRWHLSPELIATYRDMMQHAVIATREMYMLYHEPDIRGLMDRLVQGHLSLEQFLEEAQGKLRLMQMESSQ